MKAYKTLSLLLLLALFISACATTTPGVETPVATTLPPTTAVPPTDTPEPSPTPLPARALLIGDPTDPALFAALQELADESGLMFEARPMLTASELSADVKVVIYQSPPADIAALAASAPTVQFVVLTIQDLPTAANVSIIRSRPEYAQFAAGYLAAIIAPDWRAGALLPDASAQDVFINGGRYWCGRCAPTYGPVVLFPLAAVLPPGSPASDWQTGFDGIHQSRIEVLYLAPEAVSADLFSTLPPELVLLGGATPETLPARWAATVAVDNITPLQTLWPELLAGKGGQTLSSMVTLRDVNPEFLSPGRQERVEEVIRQLADGLINPFLVP